MHVAVQAWRGALKVLATKENGFTGTNILILGAAEEFFARMQVGATALFWVMCVCVCVCSFYTCKAAFG